MRRSNMVGLGRVELPTRSLGNCCSIRLSYSPGSSICLISKLAHAGGRFTLLYSAVTITLRSSVVTYKLERVAGDC